MMITISNILKNNEQAQNPGFTNKKPLLNNYNIIPVACYGLTVKFPSLGIDVLAFQWSGLSQSIFQVI